MIRIPLIRSIFGNKFSSDIPYLEIPYNKCLAIEKLRVLSSFLMNGFVLENEIAFEISKF